MGFAAVARVTDSKWIACAVRDEIAFGLSAGDELPLETTICNEIRHHQQPVTIDHVAADERFKAHATPKLYGFQSYASFPIYFSDGEFFGTLCAIDPRPARLDTPEISAMFKNFAQLISMQLQSLNQAALYEKALTDEREASQLREQFIAVLGHDLRNPLGAITSGLSLLRLSSLSPEDIETLDIIQRSAGRMSSLIDNVLDFARGRLGTGICLKPVVEPKLQPRLQQVIDELRSSSNRPVEVEFEIGFPVACDAGRLEQLLSNLVANAITHGDASSPIWVRVRTVDKTLEMTVTNLGKTIPAEVIAKLVSSVFSRPSASIAAGAGPGTLYRIRNRPGSWWNLAGQIRRPANEFYLQHACLKHCIFHFN